MSPEMFAWLDLINQATVECIRGIVNLGDTIFRGRNICVLQYLAHLRR